MTPEFFGKLLARADKQPLYAANGFSYLTWLSGSFQRDGDNFRTASDDFDISG